MRTRSYLLAMERTITGLKLLCARTPFGGMGDAVLDRAGEWTDDLFAAFEADTGTSTSPGAGLWVWEGDVLVEVRAEEEPLVVPPRLVDVPSYTFAGAWREPEFFEHHRLRCGYFALAAGNGRMPAKGEPYVAFAPEVV